MIVENKMRQCDQILFDNYANSVIKLCQNYQIMLNFESRLRF